MTLGCRLCVHKVLSHAITAAAARSIRRLNAPEVTHATFSWTLSHSDEPTLFTVGFSAQVMAICRHWKKGFCSQGSHCGFQHPQTVSFNPTRSPSCQPYHILQRLLTVPRSLHQDTHPSKRCRRLDFHYHSWSQQCGKSSATTLRRTQVDWH